MKKVLNLLSCLLIVLALAGCGRQNKEMTDQSPLTGQTRENVFPDFLVGVWQAEVSRFSKWGFKFEPDGSISRLVHMLAGPVKIEEGGIYVEGPDPGTFAVFALGPSEAKYSPANRQLSVKIFLSLFHMRLPQGDLEGRMEDYFDGPISNDGNTWTVSWRNYTWLEGANPPDPNLIEANPEKLIFSRLDLTETIQEDNVQ